ncbi:MAG: PilT/PilU family type 4a pilus ATPase [Gammaproteobacteria bacterium]|nr:PilT/PilU family type 4a pilus ATPase [Gammaproteobacteria bacterium]
MDLTPFLTLMADKTASDLFLSPGAYAHLKIEGTAYPITAESPMKGVDIRQIAYSIMNDKQQAEFEETSELNLGIGLTGVGRFRVNVFRQRGEVAIVVRYIKGEIPSVEDLNLPLVLKNLIELKRGLVLVVGATGSGKSTTLAAMIRHRNETMTGHILTIEDPIEFLHAHKKSVVDQREVGIDTNSYANALKNAMRQAPDVILIGEIRDLATMQHAITYAETGHLCLSTLHANNANQALDRILNFFPDTAHRQLLVDLSLNLRGVVSQRLVAGLGKKRVPAVEVLLQSPYISQLIQDGEIHKIKEVMEDSNEMGMRTFDQALFELYQSKRISHDEALRNADSKNNLALKMRLVKTAKAIAQPA